MFYILYLLFKVAIKDILTDFNLKYYYYKINFITSLIILPKQFFLNLNLL